MVNTIDNAFVRSYEKRVHHTFQRKGSMLMPTVRVETNIKGESHTFFRYGKGRATRKARNGEVPVQNFDHQPIVVTIEDTYAHEYIDKLDEKKESINEMQAAAEGSASALGREWDDVVLTAASGTTTTEGGSGHITKARVLKANKILRVNDVPFDDEVYGILTPNAEAELLNSVAEFTSADFISKGEFESPYRMRKWAGVNWICHSGAPGVDTASAECLIWHKSAMGVAMQEAVSTEMQWKLERQAHLVGSRLALGAGLIDPTGVIKIPVNDTLALT